MIVIELIDGIENELELGIGNWNVESENGRRYSSMEEFPWYF